MIKRDDRKVRWVVVIITVIVFLLTIKLWVSFLLNEAFIGKYERGEYDKGLLMPVMMMNFPEGYITHYNLGNAYYNTGEMEKAKDEYLEALKSVPKERICDVRLNLGLAMVALIDEQSDKLKDELNEVVNVLLEDGCATEDGLGTHKGAQKLYDEIMNTMENGSSEGKDESEDPNNKEQEQDDSNVDEKELEEWLREQQEEAQLEHNNDPYSIDYQYYDGKPW